MARFLNGTSERCRDQAGRMPGRFSVHTSELQWRSLPIRTNRPDINLIPSGRTCRWHTVSLTHCAYRWRVVAIGVCLIVTFIGGFGASMLTPPRTSVPPLFEKDHNVQVPPYLASTVA
jgi:hypothetical protein